MSAINRTLLRCTKRGREQLMTPNERTVEAPPITKEERERRQNERALAMKYQIVIILPGGGTKLRGWGSAPTDSMIIKWAVNLKGVAVTRYFPSKKGWVLIDVRAAVYGGPSGVGGHGFWSGHKRLERVFPSQEAAVMYAMHCFG